MIMPPGPPVSEAAIDFCSGVTLETCSEIDDYFHREKAQSYIKWFNATLGNKSPWGGVQLVDTAQNELGFHRFWNRINQIFGGSINLIQFVSLMSILSNEVRGDFTPQAEKMGVSGHPGIAYLFDRIQGTKRSYNTLAGNQTALQCFNNDAYIAAHRNLAGSDRFARTTDIRWSGEAWPPDVPSSRDPSVTGFLQEADFMKFRGRGFIQTTGRANYAGLVEFVQQYGGDNSTLTFYKRRWKDKPVDQVAFENTNHDWDTLFQQTDLIIAAEAVRLHNVKSGGYLALSPEPALLNGTAKGSLYWMGLRISGSSSYANTFRERVGAVLSAIEA
jgi:hypothetical protein